MDREILQHPGTHHLAVEPLLGGRRTARSRRRGRRGVRPSSTAWKSIAATISGKPPEMSSAPREYSRRPPRVETSWARMPSHFPFGAVGGRVEGGDVGRLRGDARAWADGTPGRRPDPAVPPCPPPRRKQLRIGRREAVPDLLDIVGRDPAARDLRQRDLGEPRRSAHPQAAGDELEDGQAHRGVRRIEPTRDDRRKLGFRRAAERVHHLPQRGRGGVGRGLRPDQRHRLGEIAHVVIGPGEQFGIRAARGEVADQPRLGGGKGEVAGDRGQAETAVGVRLGLEVAPQQGDLGEPPGREHQALEQVGERDHAAASRGVAGGSSSSSSP